MAPCLNRLYYIICKLHINALKPEAEFNKHNFQFLVWKISAYSKHPNTWASIRGFPAAFLCSCFNISFCILSPREALYGLEVLVNFKICFFGFLGLQYLYSFLSENFHVHIFIEINLFDWICHWDIFLNSYDHQKVMTVRYCLHLLLLK